MNKMQEELNNLIIKRCVDFGYTYMDDYSGRYMYGVQCVAIMCDNPLSSAVAVMDYLRVNTGLPKEDIDIILGEAKYDQLEERYVLYYPKMETKKRS